MTTSSPKAAPAKNYREMIAQAKKRQRSRRTLTYPICLDMALYDEMDDLLAQKRAEEIAAIGSDQPEKPERGGSLSTQGKIDELGERMNADSLDFVFKIPTPDEQAARNAAWADLDKAEQERLVPVQSREIVLACFSHVSNDGEVIPADTFGIDDLREMLPDWSYGLLTAVSGAITNRSAGAPDLPFSQTRSQRRPESAGT